MKKKLLATAMMCFVMMSAQAKMKEMKKKK